MTQAEHTAYSNEPPPDPNSEEGEEAGSGDATAVWNMVKDLHLELMFMYHRVCLKLAQIGPGWCMGL